MRTQDNSKPGLEMSFILFEEGSAPVVRDVWKLETGLPVLVERLGAGKIRIAVAENLSKLKELHEPIKASLRLWVLSLHSREPKRSDR